MDLEEFEENKIGKKVGKNHMIEDKHKIYKYFCMFCIFWKYIDSYIN